ncbi:hypothetical protein V5O48_009223 [Marasmius crinis-equi]|uniref:UBA domain-containing protein n=1 Tax=Marasmius crinis-equi TaxID=585013 RepID=A0ABR3FBR4_9AGAR
MHPYPQSDESDDPDTQQTLQSRNPYRAFRDVPSHQPRGLYDNERPSPEVPPSVGDIRSTAGAPEHVQVHDDTTPSEIDNIEEPHDPLQHVNLFFDDNRSIASGGSSGRSSPETPREPSALHNSPFLPNDWEYTPSDTASLCGPPSESNWDADDEHDDTFSEGGSFSKKPSHSTIRAQTYTGHLVEMGFSRQDVLRCMDASNNYPDLALEYLLEVRISFHENVLEVS